MNIYTITEPVVYALCIISGAALTTAARHHVLAARAPLFDVKHETCAVKATLTALVSFLMMTAVNAVWPTLTPMGLLIAVALLAAGLVGLHVAREMPRPSLPPDPADMPGHSRTLGQY